jgi:ADP-ribosylation factor GTPase-activating protein 2/3
VSPTVSTSVSSAPACTAIWASTSPSFGKHSHTLGSDYWADLELSLSLLFTTPALYTLYDVLNRSTNLDSWQLAQLRTMKVGGNQSAIDYFTKNAGSMLLNDADTRKKYQSPAAEAYRAELASRSADDAARFPAGIWVDGMAQAQAPPASAPASGEADDFFDSWDKPAESAASTPAASAAPTPPPMIGRASAPRTVTSSSLRTPSGGSKLGATRTGSASSISTSAPSTPGAGAGPKKSKLGGLGAKKASAPIDFATAERAAQDAERKAREAEERSRTEEAERKRKEEETAAAAAAKAKTSASTSSTPAAKTAVATKPAAPAAKKAAGTEQDMARLGMGMKRLAFAAAPAAAAKKQ